MSEAKPLLANLLQKKFFGNIPASRLKIEILFFSIFDHQDEEYVSIFFFPGPGKSKKRAENIDDYVIERKGIVIDEHMLDIYEERSVRLVQLEEYFFHIR